MNRILNESELIWNPFLYFLLKEIQAQMGYLTPGGLDRQPTDITGK